MKIWYDLDADDGSIPSTIRWWRCGGDDGGGDGVWSSGVTKV